MQLLSPVEGDRGDGRPGEKEARGVREVEAVRRGGGGGKQDSQGGEKREKKRENYASLRNVLQSKKCKEAGADKYRAGTGIKRYGKRENLNPLFPQS